MSEAMPQAATSSLADNVLGVAKRLVLSAHAVEQFVFLIADDSPMACPRLDHYGISVGSLEDLQRRTDEVLVEICTRLGVDRDRYV